MRFAHQGLEEALLAVEGGEVFGVPLDADEEWVVWILDGLNDVCLVASADLKLVAEVVDGLLVQAVHVHLILADDSAQARSFGKKNLFSGVEGVRVSGLAIKGLQIAVEGAVEVDVNQLGSAADAEHR